MTFWEIGVGLWSTAHCVYNSGGSRGGAWGAQAPLLFLDQTEAQRVGKMFLETSPPPPYLRVWMTGAPRLDPPLGLLREKRVFEQGRLLYAVSIFLAKAKAA